MPGSYEFGPFRLDPDRRVLTRDGEPVVLTPRAFDTLVALVELRERVAEKGELMTRLWPDHVVEEANLTQQIFTLRKALGDGQDGGTYIATVPRRGYRFVAPVRSEPVPVAATPIEHVQPVVATPTPGPSHSTWFAAGLVLLALVALGLAARRSATPALRGLVVLPLEDASGGAETHVADGLTEALINRLSQTPGLKVIARATAFRYRGRLGDAPQVGRELGVAWVVTGRMAHDAGATVVQLDLVEAVGGTQVWGQRYSLGPAELPAFARTVADALGTRLGLPRGAEQPGLAGRDAETYELYLQGRFFWNKRSPEGLQHALDLFKAATARDPMYAEAWCGLADTYALLPEYADWKEADAYPAAREAARRALELDETLAEAHTSLAFVRFWWDREWPAAEQQFKRALELNPGYATAHHWYGNTLLAMGRVPEALAQLEEAQRSDPLSLIVGTELGAALYLARRYAEADARLARTLELDARFAGAHNWAGYVALFDGHPEAALSHFRYARDLMATPSAMLAEIGLVEQRAGRLSAARDSLRRLDELSAAGGVAYDRAVLLASLGERDAALRALERAFDERSTDLSFIGLDPVFDALRGDARFVELVRRLGQPRARS